MYVMKIDTLLINPPFHRFFGSEQDYIPIGLSYLASTVDNCWIYNAEVGDNVSNISYNDRINGQESYIKGLYDDKHFIWKEIRELLLKYAPKVVGITVPTVKFKSAIKVAEIVKEILPDTFVIVGGPHATLCPRDFIDYKCIDIIIKGEGEEIFPKIVNDILKGNKKEDFNRIYDYNKFVSVDINNLKLPNKVNLLNKYSAKGYGHIVTARGCPFSCLYCSSNALLGSKVRYRKVTDIINEIEYLIKEYNVQDYVIWDETFTADRKRIIEFCEKVKPLNITWRCDTRINLIDDELLFIMKDSGLNHISVGIESGNDITLQFINKKITRKIIEKYAKILNNSGIFWKAYIMIGFPNETEEMINDTLNLIYDIKPSRVTLSIFTPYPGTPLYKYCIDNKIIKVNHDYSMFSHQSKFNHFCPNINKERFQEIVKEFSEKVDNYNNSNGGYEKWIK